MCYIGFMNTKKLIPLLIFSIAIAAIDFLCTKFVPSEMAMANIATTVLTMPIFVLMAVKHAAPGVMLIQAVVRALFLLMISPYVALVVLLFGMIIELLMLGLKKKRSFYANIIFYGVFSIAMLFRSDLALAISLGFQGWDSSLIKIAASMDLLYSLGGTIVAAALSYFLLKAKMERAGLMKPHTTK